MGASASSDLALRGKCAALTTRYVVRSIAMVAGGDAEWAQILRDLDLRLQHGRGSRLSDEARCQLGDGAAANGRRTVSSHGPPICRIRLA